MKFEQYKTLKQQLLTTMDLPQVAAEQQIATMHPLVLAYIGDAVFALYVRLRLLEREKNKVDGAHSINNDFESVDFDNVNYNPESNYPMGWKR